MQKIRSFGFLLLLINLFFAFPLPAQQNAGDVWVPPHTLPGGEVIPGYWRPPFRKGYYWVKGKEDGNGNWLPGHWNPAGRAPENQVWVPGYWDGTVIVDGYWRPVSRPGSIWVDPHWFEGRWRDGYWRDYKGGQPFRVHFPRSRR